MKGVGTGPDGGRALVFDLLGSLLDEGAGQRRAVQTVLDLPASHGERFVDRWSARFHELVTLIGTGEQPYRPPEKLYAQAAVDVAGEQCRALTPQAVSQLARFGRTLEPFPEVPAALEQLAGRHPLVALTNAGSAQAFAMSRHARLRWTTLVSGEVVQAYKPDPRMYRHVIDALDLDPTRCLFIAAHQWDLDAAAKHGFHTAYLDRQGDGSRTGHDFTASDLTGLAAQLAR